MGGEVEVVFTTKRAPLFCEHRQTFGGHHQRVTEYASGHVHLIIQAVNA